ncbi:hypothetical protein EOM39_00510 [Candidatus Gracilibacteria bacterium]|nr:hypothetical protein [Candidatus Gracilibacteria bacterium]
MINKIKITLLFFISILFGFFQFTQVEGDSDFSKPTFTITTSDIAPIGADKVPGGTLKQKADNFLVDVIGILMVSIGVIALLVVTIGAGYMIFYNGKEEFLTKGRNMIYTGFLALFIALSSYYLMNLVRYILYS